MNSKAYPSPFGKMTLSASEQGLTAIEFDLTDQSTASSSQLNPESLLDQAYLELSEYFEGKRKRFDIALDFSAGTDFMQKVWQYLANMPYGSIVSYKEIAEAIGHPKAFRAVGMANNKNPLPIICACHRVVGSDGSLTGYAYGLEMKEKLLHIEGVSIQDELIIK